MATTRYGVTGPMTAYGTFAAKEEAAGGGGPAGGSMLPLMGAGGYVWWVLTYGR